MPFPLQIQPGEGLHEFSHRGGYPSLAVSELSEPVDSHRCIVGPIQQVAVNARGSTHFDH